MLQMIKQEKWNLGVLFCCLPFEVGWGRGEGESRIEQAGFCKGLFKENKEQLSKRINPKLWLKKKKKRFPGFYEYPFNYAITNLSNNLKVILTLMLCHNVFPPERGWKKANDRIS